MTKLEPDLGNDRRCFRKLPRRLATVTNTSSLELQARLVLKGKKWPSSDHWRDSCDRCRRRLLTKMLSRKVTTRALGTRRPIQLTQYSRLEQVTPKGHEFLVCAG